MINKRGEEGGGMGLGKIITILLVLLVLIFVIFYLVKSDLVTKLKNLPGFGSSNNTEDKLIELNLDEKAKLNLCPIEFSRFNTETGRFTSTIYNLIEENGAITSIYMNSDRTVLYYDKPWAVDPKIGDTIIDKNLRTIKFNLELFNSADFRKKIGMSEGEFKALHSLLISIHGAYITNDNRICKVE